MFKIQHNCFLRVKLLKHLGQFYHLHRIAVNVILILNRIGNTRSSIFPGQTKEGRALLLSLKMAENLQDSIMKEKKRRIVMAVICAVIILSMVLAMLAPMFA